MVSDATEYYEAIGTVTDGTLEIGVNINITGGLTIDMDDFILMYYGTESTKEDSTTPIEGVESADAVTPVAYYNISGTRLSVPQKGINIVRMSDGMVRKILVK